VADVFGGQGGVTAESPQQKMRQEWQQEAQLRQEMWQRQNSQSAAREPSWSNSQHWQHAQRSSDGHHQSVPSLQHNPFPASERAAPQPHSSRNTPRNRRPSPYRDEAAALATGRGGLAPPQGADPHFDHRVRELHDRKQFLRQELWKELGGGGEPAAPGVLPSFDESVDRAWAAFRGQKNESSSKESQVSAARAGETDAGVAGTALGMLDTARSRPAPRTPFEADVHAEMDRLVAGLRQELEHEETRHHQAEVPRQAPFSGATWRNGNHGDGRTRGSAEMGGWASSSGGYQRQQQMQVSNSGRQVAAPWLDSQSNGASFPPETMDRRTAGAPRSGRRGHAPRAAQSSIQLG